MSAVDWFPSGVRHVVRSSRHTWLDVTLIVVVALAVRLAFFSSAHPFLNMDSEGYYVPARDLVAGLPFDLGLRRTPTYPLFLAGTIALLGEDLQCLVTLQHFLFGPLTALLTYALGRLLTGRFVALGAGLLAAASGPLLLYEHYVMTEALFASILLATLIAVVLAGRTGRLGWAAAGGLLFGVAILCRPAAQVIAPPLVASLFLFGRPDIRDRSAPTAWIRRRVAPAALFAGVTAAVVVPWMAYNWQLHGAFSVAGNGRFLLSRTIKQDPGGFSFERPPGLVEDETKAAARRIVQREAARRPPGSSAQRLREELELPEAQAYRIMFELAVEAIRDRPVYYLQGSAQFFLEILVGTPIAVRREGLEWTEVDWERSARAVLQRPVYSLDAARAQALLSIYDPARYGPLVPALFLAGLVAAALGLAPRGLLLPGFVTLMLVAAPALMTGPELRYRYPQDPLIALLAVQAIATAVTGIRHVEWRMQKEGA
jgi:4-amino-4-deoxy-L-arabinose transferase-like glycosyltransferase